MQARFSAPLSVLILRAEPGASRTQDAVAARGWRPIVSPLLQIERVADLRAEDVGGLQGLAFTSAAGVDAAAEDAYAAQLNSLPTYCVGDATAERARAAGFRQTISAGGDAKALSQLLATLDPRAGDVLHPCGVDLAAELGSAGGVRVRQRALYAAKQAQRLSKEAQQALSLGTAARPLAAMIHSRRIAEAFAPHIAAAHGRIVALCAISSRAAEPLPRLDHAPIFTAAAPNEEALFACCAQWIGKSSDEGEN